MAGVTTEQLFLQVDASVELLRRNLAAGEQPLDRFEQRADAMAARVDKSIAGMGKNFGAFAQLAESAAQKAERSFHDSFDQIQRMAAKAIETPRVKDGVDIGAGEARKAANLAQQQATAIGLIEKAAKRAAAGEGMLTAETRSYLQAASAARIEAEQHAAALVREAGALERLEIELKQAGAGHVLLANRQKAGIVVSGQVRAGMQQLGFQANDVAVGIAAATPPMIIFAQQSGQVIQAISLMAGESKGLLGILGGPWGIVITTALVALTPFVGKLFESNDALKKGVEELKKDANQARISAAARDIYTKSIEGQIDAQHKLNLEMERGFTSQRQTDQANLRTSQTNATARERELSERRKQLAEAQTAARAARDRVTNPDMAGGPEALAGNIAAAQFAEQKVAGLKKQVSDLVKAVNDAQQGVRDAQITISIGEATAAVDPLIGIRNQYQDLRDAAIAAAKGNDQLTASLEGTLNAISKREKSAVDTEQKRQARTAAADRDVASGALTPGAVGGMLRGEFGGTVTSTTGGKHAKNSFHYRGQAVDFVPRGGMGSISKADIRAYLEAEGVDIKELLGPGDKGHDDHFHVAFGKTSRGQDAIDQRRAAADRREEAARIAVLKDDTAYNEQERQARRRLLEATGKTAASEEERDRLVREDINAEADAANKKIANQLSAKEITPAQAKHLAEINEATRLQRLQNVEIERASETIRAGVDARAQSIDEQLAALQIEGDLAKTQKARRDVELRILALQEERERILQQAIIDDPKSSPADKDRAGAAIRAVDNQHAGRVAQIENRTKGPWDTYLDSMRNATGQTEEALEQVAVNGMSKFNDQLTTAASKILKIGGAFGEVADQIISDLIRIAIQEAMTAIFGGGGGGGAVGASSGGGIPIGQIFAMGGISGGAFAAGGDPPVGRVSLVGERGPELFVPRSAGTIIPNGQSLRLPSLPSPEAMRGAGSTSVSISMPVQIDAAGADPATLARVEQTLNQHMVQLPGQIIATMNDGISRGYTRR